jgi:LAO/AO transport system kinase
MQAAELFHQLKSGDQRTLARCISLVENKREPSREILRLLEHKPNIPVFGITGPPGAGKSSLVNALCERWLEQGKKVAVIAVDPTSPFNFGSLLGDRLRMSGLYLHPNLFIRSMATRGSLGGLSPKIIETCDLVKQAGFDLVVIETVGVGQSEVEIAGVADTTVVVMVPEAGDEVQTMKSGVMEIADVFVVNKSDRQGADIFARHLQQLSLQRHQPDWKIPVLLTRADQGDGIPQLDAALQAHRAVASNNDRNFELLFEKSLQLMREELMRSIDTMELRMELTQACRNENFNLYRFVSQRLPQ